MQTKTYAVTFVADHFIMRVHVESRTNNHDRLVSQASALIEEQYGWDLDATENIYFMTHVDVLEETDIQLVDLRGPV